MKKEKTISVRLEEDLYKATEKRALLDDDSIGKIVRKALRNFLPMKIKIKP